MKYPPILVVDKQDNPIGKASMEEIQAKGLYHRIVRIHVEDKEGRILLQKRASTVSSFPNCWDHSASGHVDAAENYEQAAERELFEEIGIRSKLKEIGMYQSNYVYGDRIFNRFNKVYKAVVDRETVFTLEPEEVSEVKWATLDEIKQMIKNTPDQIADGLEDVINQFYSHEDNGN